jgi:hypothetical protein
MKTLGVFAVLAALLGFALWGAHRLWSAAGVEIGWFGWAIIGVGAALTIGLGVGLMALSFHSARAGYDNRAQDASNAIDRALDRTRGQGD